MIIFIYYWTLKVHYHFPKSVNVLSFHVNCGMIPARVAAQRLPLRNNHISTTLLLNKQENINIYMVVSYAILLDHDNYIYCLYYWQPLKGLVHNWGQCLFTENDFT